MTARTSRPVKRPAARKPSIKASAPRPNLVSLDDYLGAQGKAILLHGPSGHGKTVLAAIEAPKPMLVLDLDGGVGSLEGMPNSDKVFIWPASDGVEYTWDDMDDFRNYVKGGDWSHEYLTILVDNVTAGQKPVINFAISEAIRRLHPDKKDSRDPDIPSQQDWGKIYRVYDRWIRDIRDAKRRGTNVIFTAGTSEWMDEDAGFARLQPNLEGAERKQIATHMDAVGYLEVEDEVRMLHMAPSGATVTKIRLPYSKRDMVPTAIENPDFNKMMAAVKALPPPKERSAKTTKKPATKKRPPAKK